jgi:hypothetical protein
VESVSATIDRATGTAACAVTVGAKHLIRPKEFDVDIDDDIFKSSNSFERACS